MPAGHLHHVLLAGLFRHVGHRRRLAARRQTPFPQLLAGLQVIGAQVVIQRTAHECHATGGDDGPTERRRTHRERQAQRRTITAGAVLVHPHLLHGAQVHGGHIAPGRRLARQTEHRQERLQAHHIRRPQIGLQAGLTAAHLLIGSDLAALDHLRDECQVVRRAKQKLPLRIHGYRRPVEHADVARIDQRALLRRRGKVALVTQLAELDTAEHLVDWRTAPHVPLAQWLLWRIAQGRRGLGGCGAVAVIGALRYRYLVDWHDGLASTPVKHIQIAALGRLDDRRHLALRAVYIHQGRLRWQVTIPEVVVHGLKLPAHLAGRQIQRDQGGREPFGQLVTGGRPLIRGLVAHRQIDKSQGFIGGRDRPDVGRAAHIGFARRQRLGGVGIARIEIPHQLAGLHVIGANHAPGRIHRAVIGDRTALNHQLAGYHGWRGRQIDTKRTVPQTSLEVDRAGIAEVFTRLTILDIQRHQGAVVGRQEQALFTAHSRLVGLLGGIGGCRSSGAIVIGQATAGHMLVVLGITVDARIEPPALLTGVRIQRDGHAVGRADKQGITDFQRRDLIGQLMGIALARQIPGMKFPGLFQLAGVFRGDQISRGVAITLFRATISRPLTRRALRHTISRLALHLRIAEFAIDGMVILGQRITGH